MIQTDVGFLIYNGQKEYTPENYCNMGSLRITHCEKEKHLPNFSFLGSMLNFGGVQRTLGYTTFAKEKKHHTSGKNGNSKVEVIQTI